MCHNKINILQEDLYIINMKKDLGVLPAVFPMPVLMVGTYGENDTVDVMNVAWGGICGEDKIALNLAPDRKTLANIRERKAFTVALADEDHIKEADFFGIATGNKMPDKFARTGFHAEKSKNVDAPIISEFSLTMECELLEVREMYGDFRVVGKIVNVIADENILNSAGKVDPSKLKAVMFDQYNMEYYATGGKVAKAWNAGAGLMKE